MLSTGIDWSPTIGDPTVGGWLTVVAYAVATLCCYRSAHADWRNRNVWASLGIFELLLGINKQLDLQVLVTEVGRYLAKQEAWYQDRREVQLAFIAALVVLFALLIATSHLCTRSKPLAVRIALLGTSVELIFVAMRAASFHHIDAFLKTHLVGTTANFYLENFGILIVTASAWATLNSRRAPRT
ncbi:MAG: hypothetical protein JSR79_06795 [Proteobacteria bacterium]|nr:hypothetical protein [Pseudomonadota bacterium]